MELLIALLVSLAAAAVVLTPVLRRPRAAVRPRLADEVAVEAEVARYREAIRAGTLCERCRFANPPESRYCAECGRRLAPDPA